MVSTLGPADDLTIQNTSSASYSLTVMTVVAAVLLPLVLVYQGWTYYVFRTRLGRRPGTLPATEAPAGQIPAPRRPAPDRRAVGGVDGTRRSPPTSTG
jgi:cytochrome d ubiquinol oxidase subunit II